MRWLFSALLALHGLIHLMGFAKAFGLAELPRLVEPVSPLAGLVWLAAALLLLTTAAVVTRRSEGWWMPGLAGLILSQTAILGSWTDARFGTVANVLVLVGVVYGFAAHGPFSFRTAYRRAVAERLAAAPAAMPVVREEELERLPEPVGRYLRHAGVVGQPHVHRFRARLRGRIRGGPEEPWMPYTAEQHDFVDEPARFFLMDARRGGLPVDVYHALHAGVAAMRVRLLSLFPVVDSRGADLDRAEAVTFFNDLCVFAPAALLRSAVTWEQVDAHSVRARYRLGANTIAAVLSFDTDGGLVDFVSDDRMAASGEGGRLEPVRWSTPLAERRTFGSLRVASRGEGRWHPPGGAYTYIELEVLELETNPEA